MPSAATSLACSPEFIAAAPATQQAAPGRPPASLCELLGSYIDAGGSVREIVLLPGALASWLLIDRLSFRGLDARLIAHLAADEPLCNAHIAAELYLADTRRGCRRLDERDLLEAPLATPARGDRVHPAARDQLTAPDGATYGVEIVPSAAGQEARWVRRSGFAQATTVSLREAMGALELSTELRARTNVALEHHRRSPEVSTSTLRAEVRRLDASPLVLNRRLRQAVLAAVAGGELSLSAIAMRCGRIKRDRRGRRSGETSWLARRVGLLPEGGGSRPTPWVHAEVLALIARRGLSIAPREVELG